MQKKIERLWYPYILYGKRSLLQGDPGEGKSTFILNAAALPTRGTPMSDGFPAPLPQTVIYRCAEDTVKPRLIAANADCEKSRIPLMIPAVSSWTMTGLKKQLSIRGQAFLSSIPFGHFFSKTVICRARAACVGFSGDCR